ncbi:MAG: hypothetical protein AAF394_02825 [Planctomycetota bacterium]
MTLLDDLQALPASMRRLRLGHGDTRDSLVALGRERGIAWLEEHLESPIGPEWARLLYALEPEWKHFDRWIRRSKLHCLAAVDALVLFASGLDSDGNEAAPMPHGADPAAIDALLTFALDNYDNPRLQAAAKRIRHAWPVGTPTRHAVGIPAPIDEFASRLFGREATLMRDWIDSLANGLNAPQNPSDYWHSLLHFGGRVGIIAIVDWRAFPDSIIGRLRSLRGADRLPIPWEVYEDFDAELEALFSELNLQVKGSGQSLVSLDTGSDSYALTFVESDTLPTLESFLASALDMPPTIQAFA